MNVPRTPVTVLPIESSAIAGIGTEAGLLTQRIEPCGTTQGRRLVPFALRLKIRIASGETLLVRTEKLVTVKGAAGDNVNIVASGLVLVVIPVDAPKDVVPFAILRLLMRPLKVIAPGEPAAPAAPFAPAAPCGPAGPAGPRLLLLFFEDFALGPPLLSWVAA